MRSDLAEGHYAPGDKLPTEAGMAERFGVNRHTVRHRISALVDEGFSRRRREASATFAVTESDPLLRSSGVNVDQERNPVEYGRTWFVGDRITRTLEHKYGPA